MSGFYEDAAEWWPLFSPPIHYVEEAADLLARLRERRVPDGSTLVEFGSGGGSLAFHLKPHFQLTLTDLSPGMLAVNRTVNPECEHVQGDMRTLRLDRQFDIVLVHDAVMYMTTPGDLRAALRTAAVHCRAGGVVVVLPDYVRETFEPGTDSGGEDGGDGRGLRSVQPRRLAAMVWRGGLVGREHARRVGAGRVHGDARGVDGDMKRETGKRKTQSRIIP